MLTETLHHSDEVVTMDNSHHYYSQGSATTTTVSEIEEECSTQLHLDDGPMTTISEEKEKEGEEEEPVYVAVGKSQTSMEALSWTLNNLVTPSTTLYLVHVFPEIKHIPNPLGVGMVPKDQVSTEQVESYMAQERGKRRELLHKFIQLCSASKVKVDTILIESDLIAKAIIDLIPILQIRKLVIGTNKSQLRKLRSKKGNSMADQILQNAPESCKVRIICEGEEVNQQTANDTSMSHKEEDQKNDWFSSLSCICF
uniref:UspA domain-containing protein n=1 Tax=Lotus japonicus TaxID=34305 RepID=I3S183_LOTJA|nr:unknown [Lotus japonicus]